MLIQSLPHSALRRYWLLNIDGNISLQCSCKSSSSHFLLDVFSLKIISVCRRMIMNKSPCIWFWFSGSLLFDHINLVVLNKCILCQIETWKKKVLFIKLNCRFHSKVVLVTVFNLNLFQRPSNTLYLHMSV